MRTILSFIVKEFQQLLRDKRMLMVIFTSPLIQLLLLGYAASFDLDVIHTAVYDMDRSHTSRDIIDQFSKSGYFVVDRYVNDYKELSRLFDDGKILAAIVIPEDFERNLFNLRPAPLQAILDGSDSRNAIVVNGYVQTIISGYSRNLTYEILSRKGMRLPETGAISTEERILFNPDLKPKNFMVPNIMGLVLMTVAIGLMSVAIVKERENGTLEQLIVTPVKPWQMISGKLVPYAILSFIAMLGVLLATVFWFGIHIKGSILLLLTATFLFLISNLGFGVFVSTFCKTQQQALMISIFMVQLPMIYFSGFAFPIDNMPLVIQYFSNLIPLKYYIIILRGIVLKGTGFYSLWHEILIILLIGAVVITGSILRFKKRIE
ncbi:MAG TPA: ABC transporter permease [Ignavibacteriales bacterium]|nr:ABC transporter permease [Ignavibacteriales bacterium]